VRVEQNQQLHIGLFQILVLASLTFIRLLGRESAFEGGGKFSN